MTDWLDGKLARAWKQQSELGRFLDPVADKLLVATTLFMLGVDGRFSRATILPALVILCREILVSGLREHLAGLRVPVPVSRLAKWKTGIQMVAIGVLLVGDSGPAHVPVRWIGEVLLWIAGGAHRQDRLGLSARRPGPHPGRSFRTQGGEAEPRLVTKIFGLAGWSGSGKTTLVVRLIPALIARGLTVSTVKHAHHAFDIDQPGKDSWVHRQAGAREVMVSSQMRWALMHEHRGAPEPGLAELLSHMSPVDLVIVEGFKREPFEKLEIHRPSLGKPLLCVEDPDIVAVASDAPIPRLTLPRLALDDVEAIASFIIARCRLETADGAAQR